MRWGAAGWPCFTLRCLTSISMKKICFRKQKYVLCVDSVVVSLGKQSPFCRFLVSQMKKFKTRQEKRNLGRGSQSLRTQCRQTRYVSSCQEEREMKREELVLLSKKSGDPRGLPVESVGICMEVGLQRKGEWVPWMSKQAGLRLWLLSAIWGGKKGEMQSYMFNKVNEGCSQGRVQLHGAFVSCGFITESTTLLLPSDTILGCESCTLLLDYQWENI